MSKDICFENIDSSAEISDCGRYRWHLRRQWGSPHYGSSTVTFVMLNPSTANANIDDPTIRRCVRFAHDWGYDAMDVVNLFCLRATNPKELLLANDPYGVKCDDYLKAESISPGMVVCAWGAFVPFERDKTALNLLNTRKIHALGLTIGGQPKHPLYLPKSSKHFEWFPS